MEAVAANALVTDKDLVGATLRCIDNNLVSTLGAVEDFTGRADLAASSDKVSISRADAHGAVPVSVVTARGSDGLALVGVTIELEARTARLSSST